MPDFVTLITSWSLFSTHRFIFCDDTAMFDYFRKLFEVDFMPHGHCYFWEPGILWSHAISDSIIAMAYMTIPVSLIYIFRRRRDFKYVWMAVIFAIFIFGCGLTHVFDVINIWRPYYRIDSVIRVITATASIGAAVVLVKVTPKITRIPTEAQWVRVNEELRQQLQELQEKDRIIDAIRLFEELAEAAPQIMWVNDRNGTLTYINKKWHEYSGSDAATMDQGESLYYWKNFIHPAEYDAIYALWKEALETGQKHEAEFRIRNRDGEYRWFLSRSLPVTDRTGAVGRWFGTLTDIHEQKKQNEILQKTNSDLDNFVYAASHDLRAPITNMAGVLAILNEELKIKQDEYLRKYLQMLTRSVDKLNNVIDDLTEVSRLEKDIHDTAENLRIDQSLDELESELQQQIQNSSATIIRKLDAPTVYFSKKNLRSILYNLITNSIKYCSPERSPVITINTYETNDYFVMEVQDNGRGFDPKKKGIIFELFTRLHSDPEGSGVGLFIVKRIVDNAGGKIEVESIPGTGSKFRIFFKHGNGQKI